MSDDDELKAIFNRTPSIAEQVFSIALNAMLKYLNPAVTGENLFVDEEGKIIGNWVIIEEIEKYLKVPGNELVRTNANRNPRSV